MPTDTGSSKSWWQKATESRLDSRSCGLRGNRQTGLRQPTRRRAPPPGGAPPATLALRAPAAGIVARSTAVLGAVASPQAEPLFRITVNGDIELEVEVPSIHVPKLKRDANQTARVELENGVALGGRVRRVPIEVDRTTQLGRARLALDRVPS